MTVGEIAQLASLIALFHDGGCGLVHVFVRAGSRYATLSNFRESVCRGLNRFVK